MSKVSSKRGTKSVRNSSDAPRDGTEKTSGKPISRELNRQHFPERGPGSRSPSSAASAPVTGVAGGRSHSGKARATTMPFDKNVLDVAHKNIDPTNRISPVFLADEPNYNSVEAALMGPSTGDTVHRYSKSERSIPATEDASLGPFIVDKPPFNGESTAPNLADYAIESEVPAENYVGEVGMDTNDNETARQDAKSGFAWCTPLTEKVSKRKPSTSLQPMPTAMSMNDTSIQNALLSHGVTEKIGKSATLAVDRFHGKESSDQRSMKEEVTWPALVTQASSKRPPTKSDVDQSVESTAPNLADYAAFSSESEVPAEKYVGEVGMDTNGNETARQDAKSDFAWCTPPREKVSNRKPSTSMQPMPTAMSMNDTSIQNALLSHGVTDKIGKSATLAVDRFHGKESDQRFMKEEVTWPALVTQASSKRPPTKSDVDHTNRRSKSKNLVEDNNRLAEKLDPKNMKHTKESVLLSSMHTPADNVTNDTIQMVNQRKRGSSISFRLAKRGQDVPPKRFMKDEPVTTHWRALYDSLALSQLRRTNQKKTGLFVLAILAVIFMLAFLLVLFGKFEAKGLKYNPDLELKLTNTCSSLSCIHHAAYLNSLLDWDADPCDDFYMFVCNHWTSQFPVLGDTFSTDDDYAGELEDTLYYLLGDENRTDVTPAMRRLFEQCQDAKRLENDGWNALLDLLAQVSLEGFPFTPPVRNLSVWKLAAQLLRKAGVTVFFGVGITSHPSQGKDMAALRLPETLSGTDGADISKLIRLYSDAVQASLNALKKEFIPPVHSLNVVRFATQLEKLYQLHSADRNFSVQVMVPNSSLDIFLAEVFRGLSPSVYQARNNEVLVDSPRFTAELEEMIRNTDTVVVMNFLGVRLMVQVSPFLPNSNLLDFYSSLMYRKPLQGLPRWKLCVRTVERAFPSPFLRLSLFDIREQALEKKLADFTIDIKQEFLSDIESADYLNEASKAAIRSLISKTRFEVFSPSWMKGNDLLEKFVLNLPSSARQSLESYVLAHEYSFLDKLRRRSSDQWPQSAFGTTCWHEPGSRTIYVPMLVFNVSLAQNAEMTPLQLSRAGVRIGCCIYDMLISEASSPYTSDQWLNDDTLSRLTELQRCIGGKMAALRDASATRLAYSHFERAYKRSGKPLSLRLAPNNDLTGEQLFFIYLLLQSCERRPAGGTSTSWSRVTWNAAVRHQRGFHDAFHCVRGSAMNPEQSCNV